MVETGLQTAQYTLTSAREGTARAIAALHAQLKNGAESGMLARDSRLRRRQGGPTRSASFDAAARMSASGVSSLPRMALIRTTMVCSRALRHHHSFPGWNRHRGHSDDDTAEADPRRRAQTFAEQRDTERDADRHS